MGRGNFLPIVAVTLLILIATGFILFRSMVGNPTPTSPSPTPSITQSGLPPLYPDIEWGNPERVKITFITMKNGFPKTIDGWRTTSSTLDRRPLELLNYYRKELRQRGWELVETTGDIREFYKLGSEKYFSFSLLSSGNPETYVVVIEYN